MGFSKITYRRRRRRGLRGKPLEQRRGFWSKLRSPTTLRLIFWMSLLIYRIYRFLQKVYYFFE